MQRSLSFARYVAFGFALVVLAVLAVLFAYEQSGELAVRVRADLARRLGNPDVPIEVGGASLGWFDASVTLSDVRLGQDGELVRLDRVRAKFALLAEGGPELESLELAGGRVVAGRALVDLLRGPRRTEPGAEGQSRTPPRLAVEGLVVELDHPELGRLRLGTVDARASADGGSYGVQGRWHVELGTRDACELYLEGHALDAGRYELVAWSNGFQFDGSTLPERGFCAPLVALAPRGTLKLTGRCVIDFASPEPTRGYVRASLVDGALRPSPRAQELVGATLELETHLDPRAGETWSDAGAWYGALNASAGFGDARGSVFADLGRSAGARTFARGFVVVRDADVVQDELAAFGVPVETLHALDAFGVGGRADARMGFEWRESNEFAFALECEAKGDAQVSFRGFEDPNGERRGFAWPIEAASGRALVTYEPRLPHATHVAIVGARGRGRDGKSRAVCEGIARTSVESPWRVDYDFALAAHDVPVDETLRVGLHSASGSDAIWERFSPRNGAVTVEGRVHHLPADPGPAMRFDAELTDIDAAWSELPIPCDRLSGKLALVFDPRGIAATSFELAGSLATSDGVSVRGRWQDDPAAAERVEGERHVEALSIHAANLALKGAQRDVIVERFPGVGSVLDEFGASGRVDVDVSATRATHDGARRFDFEITPRVVQLAPRAFQVQTRNVHGRVIVTALETPPETPTGSPGADVTTIVAPLVGDWSGSTRVAFQALFPPRGAAELELAGAGLNLQNRALVGAFNQANADANGGGLDLDALSLDGRIDFRGELSLPDDASPAKSRYEVYLRENGIQLGGGMSFGLQRLSGLLVQSEGRLSGEALSAYIGRTPVALRRARFQETDGVYRLEAEPEAYGLPLDREHMRFFLDDDTLLALEQQLRWRGTIDIFDAKLVLVGSSPTDSRLGFSGAVIPHGMYVDFGLPLEIDEARARIHELVFEHGEVRAWAEIDGLSGRVADRRLADAHMLVTYVEPRLSILDLDGRLEGGRLSALGGRVEANGSAFAVGLREPYDFELGLRLEEVDVAGLLRGLFESDFASSGKLSGDLRLAGQLDHILGIQGRGEVDIADSRLWSIPVVRDLFAQLGYDKPAVFRRVRSRFEVAEGRIDMKSLYVESPLAQLVGTGSLDLDGRLAHDLEVKYGLVDNLGPVTRFLYWVQNNLLRVEIRGDMARPKILLRGMLSFLQGSKSERRDLPVPSFAPIPERF
ncbi:MAG: hypothetical protein HZA52_02370 [Planctomycetes bacterium]|nr:hypothetical protein [Planctomycetota bacterium]